MSQFLATILPIAIMLLAVMAILGPLMIWKRNRHRTRRSPLVNQLLRSPGESLRKDIEDITFDLAALIVYTPLLVVVVFASHISASYLGGQPETLFRLVLSSVMALGVMTYGLIKISRLARRRANLQVGYEGELAVAQELSQLMRNGALVFHDVPGEGFNIDRSWLALMGPMPLRQKRALSPCETWGKTMPR